MNACIYYATRSGNTRRVAGPHARARRDHGPGQLVELDGSPVCIAATVELVIVGGPTEGRHATPAVTAFFDALPPDALRGRQALAFDTRLPWPRWLFGSAAADIADRLVRAGAHLATDPESFYVTTAPDLRPGELDRAERWAASLAGTSTAGLAPVLARLAATRGAR
jgi:flavodoxin